MYRWVGICVLPYLGGSGKVVGLSENKLISKCPYPHSEHFIISNRSWFSRSQVQSNLAIDWAWNFPYRKWIDSSVQFIHVQGSKAAARISSTSPLISVFRLLSATKSRVMWPLLLQPVTTRRSQRHVVVDTIGNISACTFPRSKGLVSSPHCSTAWCLYIHLHG